MHWEEEHAITVKLTSMHEIMPLFKISFLYRSEHQTELLPHREATVDHRKWRTVSDEALMTVVVTGQRSGS